MGHRQRTAPPDARRIRHGPRAAWGPGHGAPAPVNSTRKLGYKNTMILTRTPSSSRRARVDGYWSDRGYEWYGRCVSLPNFRSRCHDAPSSHRETHRHSCHRAADVPARAVAPTRAALRVCVHVRIENVGKLPAPAAQQTVGEFTDSIGEDSQVEGEGVIGEQPIAPGKVHEYQSFIILKSPIGHMKATITSCGTMTRPSTHRFRGSSSMPPRVRVGVSSEC